MGVRITLVIACIAGCLGVPASAQAVTDFVPGNPITEAGGARFGASVSLSGDGYRAVVGQPDYNGGVGAALIYERTDDEWDFVERLEPIGHTGTPHFGASVSMDHSGDSVVVGGPDNNGGIGAAWVFAEDADVWSEQGMLLAAMSMVGNGHFGTSVSMASSGASVVAGAPDHNGGVGLAAYFNLYQGEWGRTQTIFGDGVIGSGRFGQSVALTRNTSFLAIGAPDDDGDGAVYIFSIFGLESPFFQQRDRIEAPAAASDFGAAVDYGTYNMYVVIGAPAANGGDGAAYVYGPSAGAWTMKIELQHDSAAGGEAFGTSVSSTDIYDSDILVGAPGANGGAGAAYNFVGAAFTWDQDGAAFAPAGAAAGDQVGASVAMAGDGAALLVGAPNTAAGAGAVYPHGMPLQLPTAPEGVFASASNTSALVWWSTPAFNGYTPVIDYTVTATPGGQSCTTADTMCTFNGLSNGTSYTFVVTARNAVGSSVASAPSLPATPSTIPGAPRKVLGVASSRTVRVTWYAPASNGGAAITRYKVTAFPGGRSCSSSTRACSITGLTNGKAYRFHVIATNVSGNSTASAKSNAITPLRRSPRLLFKTTSVKRPYAVTLACEKAVCAGTVKLLRAADEALLGRCSIKMAAGTRKTCRLELTTLGKAMSAQVGLAPSMLSSAMRNGSTFRRNVPLA